MQSNDMSAPHIKTYFHSKSLYNQNDGVISDN